MKHFWGIIPLACMLVIAYFTYHGIYGNRGLLRLEQMREERRQEEMIAREVAREKELLQKKVQALKNGAPDLIEEQALRVLNMGDEGDLVIFD